MLRNSAHKKNPKQGFLEGVLPIYQVLLGHVSWLHSGNPSRNKNYTLSVFLLKLTFLCLSIL